MDDLGVGNAKKNTAVCTTILIQVKNFLQQKIITMGFVVQRRKDSNRETIVGVDVLDIALNAGSF